MKAGHRLALNTLFTKYYASLCRFAFSFVRNTQESEELVKDVFYQLWKKREQLNIERNVKSYLFASVCYACLAALQKQVVVFQRLEDVLEHPQENVTPENVSEHAELTALIEQAIDHLPERVRQVFVLSRFENLKYTEIAAVLELSEKTVESHITKALAHLRGHLRKYYPSLPVSK